LIIKRRGSTSADTSPFVNRPALPQGQRAVSTVYVSAGQISGNQRKTQYNKMRLLTDLLIRQTREAHSWVNKLTEGVAADKWFITPEILETNFGWQVGHLTLSQ
jgi:hypothetical protein